MKKQKHFWKTYYDKVDGRPPRQLLQDTLTRFNQAPQHPAPPFAIDLGCGTGIETMALLSAGWRVLAIDKEATGVDRLQQSIAKSPFSEQLTTQTVGFENLSPLPAAQLVHASYSLPFCHPAHFDTLWANIKQAIVVNGRFTGHLFGNRDSWATIPKRSHHTLAQVKALFTAFDLEQFTEEEKDGNTASGKPKHWHVFHIIARKK